MVDSLGCLKRSGALCFGLSAVGDLEVCSVLPVMRLMIQRSELWRWRENHLRLLSDGKRSRRRRLCACDETDDGTDGPRAKETSCLGAEIEAFV